MRTRKTWREKMENPNLPKVVDIPPKMQKRLGTGTLLLPSPRDVETVIRGIRKGKVMTVGKIREYLAAKYATTSACPLVTGIFVRISAEAAEEDAREARRGLRHTGASSRRTVAVSEISRRGRAPGRAPARRRIAVVKGRVAPNV